MVENKKTKEEVIDETLREVKKDLLVLEFGSITIYVQKGFPFREKIEISKKVGRGLDKGSQFVKIYKRSEIA